MGIRGELFSTKVVLENRTYFFNVKENRTGDLFLNVVESKPNEGEGFERHQIVLFAEDMKEFLTGLDDSLRFMEKEVSEKRKKYYAAAKSARTEAGGEGEAPKKRILRMPKGEGRAEEGSRNADRPEKSHAREGSRFPGAPGSRETGGADRGGYAKKPREGEKKYGRGKDEGKRYGAQESKSFGKNAREDFAKKSRGGSEARPGSKSGEKGRGGFGARPASGFGDNKRGSPERKQGKSPIKPRKVRVVKAKKEEE